MKRVLKKETNCPLTVYEQYVLLPILKKGLELKKGKVNAVTRSRIVDGLRRQGLRVNMRSVKKIINYIRTNDLIVGLMASSIGYYITNNEQELISYEANLMGREAALRKVRMTMQRQRKSMFSKIEERQTQLF